MIPPIGRARKLSIPWGGGGAELQHVGGWKLTAVRAAQFFGSRRFAREDMGLAWLKASTASPAEAMRPR
jgi:hypothetical protein